MFLLRSHSMPHTPPLPGLRLLCREEIRLLLLQCTAIGGLDFEKLLDHVEGRL
jgi:hypothetical protein